jgi:general secretion pathway protein A
MNTTDQVKNFFGFIKLPFSKGMSVNELYLSAPLKEAMSRLELAVDNEEAALLTASSGCGKSNIIRYFVHKLDDQSYKTAYVGVSSHFKIGDIAKHALLELGVPAPYQAAGAVRKFRDTAEEINTSRGQKVILIIDEAQDLSPEVLAGLKGLINYRMDNDNFVFLLLCGQKNLLDNLTMVPLESLRRRIRIQYEIAPLSLEETTAYICHHLTTSGVKEKIITDDAIALIYQITRGVPAKINRYCFEAIIKAAVQSKSIIEPSMIQAKKL